MEKLTFRGDTGEETEFYVLEQTRIGGVDYILVTDTEYDDGEAVILKDVSEDTDAEGIYETVEDDDEFDAVAGVFENMLEDVDFKR